MAAVAVRSPELAVPMWAVRWWTASNTPSGSVILILNITIEISTSRATLLVLFGGQLISVVSTSEQDTRAMLGGESDLWQNIKTKVNTEGRISLKTDSDLASYVTDLVNTAGYFCFRARRMKGNQDRDLTFFCLKAWRLSNIELNDLYEQSLQ